MAGRAAERGDGGRARERVVLHQGALPFEIGEAQTAHGGDFGEEFIDQHAQRQPARLPAAGGKTSEKAGPGGLFVEVEGEGIELGGEGDDIGLADPARAEGDGFADRKIFEMAAVGGYRIGHWAARYVNLYCTRNGGWGKGEKKGSGADAIAEL